MLPLVQDRINNLLATLNHLNFGYLVLTGDSIANDWERITLRNTAHVYGSLDFKVALVSPGGTPRVFDDIIQQTVVIVTESDSENGMVHICGTVFALGAGVDTTLVEAEVVHDFEGDTNGSFGINGINESNLVIGGDVEGSTRNIGDDFILAEPAMSVSRFIRVGLFALETSSILDILESMRRKASRASVIVEVSGAINQLLLRQQYSLVLVDLPVSFKSASG